METSKGRILVVDDDEANRLKLSVSLQEAGYEVTLAANGQEALDLLRAGNFDTVLLDLMMPVMDGFTVLEQVFQEKELQNIPFIVISADDELESVVRSIELGAVDYLAKPFNAVLLRARINASLDKKRSHERETALFSQLQQRYLELEQVNSKVQEQAEMLKELSIRDPLTGLYNRRYFDEQAAKTFAQAVRFGHPLSVMMGDIDFFKNINDNFSHATGDEVLRRVGSILQTHNRQSDIVARYGGEEFVIAFCETPLAQAVEHCEQLRQRIENHPWHEINPALRVTMSMGLCADVTLGSLDQLIAAADEKLYEAKAGGRNRICAAIPQTL